MPIFACSPLQVTEGKGVLDIRLLGKPFARYVYEGATKPYVWPIYASDGTNVTRNYPMIKSIEGEDKDHEHHRGFWFTHGDINGKDFWMERAGRGKVIQQSMKHAVTEKGLVLNTVSHWVMPEGAIALKDTRVYTFHTSDEPRVIDMTVTLEALDQHVKFGDTKEGTCAIRVPKWMTVKGKTGHIVNSEGNRDGDAWGKRASWVDYYGVSPQGKTIGVAIFDTPGNLRYPTYWHARDYGLFAANPFGLHDFLKDKTQDGSITLQSGEKLTLSYRLVVHMGDTAAAKIPEMARAYQKTKK